MDPLHQVLLSSTAAIMAGIGGEFNANAMRPYFDPSDNQHKVAMVVNGETQAFVTNAPATLRIDEWKDIDRTVIETAVRRLVGIQDLISRGLTHPLGSVGVTVSLWDRQSDMTPAEVDMDGVTPGEEDLPMFSPAQVPVPIIHKDFRVNWRHLEASRRFGQGIDVTASAIAARQVAEKSEAMLFSGDPIKVDGQTIYGYTNHPDRNTVDLTTAWTSITQANNYLILADVAAMMAQSRADRHFGPWMLYVPAAYEGKLDEDYRAAGDSRALRERLMSLSGIAEIKVADFLPANNVVLIELTRETVDLAIAQDIVTVEWPEMGGMQKRYKVMAVWVPRVKGGDYDGRSGLVHLRAA